MLLVMTTGQASSSFSLVGETVFRFLSVNYPVVYHNHLQSAWAKPLLAVASVWSLAICIMFPIHIEDKPGMVDDVNVQG